MSSRDYIVAIGGVLVPILLPCLHLGVLYRHWTSHKREVNKELCSCTCWDTIFKGTYEEGEAPGYKHIYFNVTIESFLIWSLTVMVTVGLYEFVRFLISLAINSRLNPRMTALVLASLYPHYYTWWSYVNAINDGFYSQFVHQAVYSITEIIATALVLPMCDRSRVINIRHLVVVAGIAVFHLCAGAYDRFAANLMLGDGAWHQSMRDMGFVMTDLAAFLLTCVELRKAVPSPCLSSALRTLTFDEVFLAVFAVIALSFVIVFM